LRALSSSASKEPEAARHKRRKERQDGEQVHFGKDNLAHAGDLFRRRQGPGGIGMVAPANETQGRYQRPQADDNKDGHLEVEQPVIQVIIGALVEPDHAQHAGNQHQQGGDAIHQVGIGQAPQRQLVDLALEQDDFHGQRRTEAHDAGIVQRRVDGRPGQHASLPVIKRLSKRAARQAPSAVTSLRWIPPKPPLLMITTLSVSPRRWQISSMIASMTSSVRDGTGDAATTSSSDQSMPGGWYQITSSASITLSGKRARCTPIRMVLERGSIMASIFSSPTLRRSPCKVVAMAVG